MVHKSQNQIVFIDTDNTRNRLDSYLGGLGTPGYMAPEVYRKPDLKLANKYNISSEFLSNCGRITPDSDIFSAAVIAFQLLTLQHPFIGDKVEDGTPEEEENALEIKTDYILKKGTTNNSTSNLVPYFEDLTTPEIRDLFYRTFVDGKDNPHLRPDDNEFLEAFQNAYDTIAECPKCGYSKLYLFQENDENRCINCNEKIGPKVVITMHNAFKYMNKADLINSIGNFPKFDIDIENPQNTEGKRVISKIILEQGKEKYLYLRHFEDDTQRSEKYAKIILSTEATLSVEILNNKFNNANLKELKTGKLIPLNNGKENIKYDRYLIIFDTKKQGKGILGTYCTFKKV